MANFKHAWSEKNQTDEASESNALASTGAALKQGREALGLSLHDLASQLHMGDEQLTALEAGDRSNLPEAVFIRASVRRVANKLGLNPEPLIAKLRDLDQTSERKGSQLPRDSSNLPKAKSSKPAETTIKPQHRGWGWLRLGTGLVALSAALATGWSWSQNTNRQPPQQQHANNTKTAAPPTSTTTTAQDKAITTVTILTSEPSWIALRNQRGDLLFEGMVDQEKTLTTDQPLEIYAGRPDLVRVNLGGHQQGPLGPIDQMRWYPITAAPSPTAPTL